MNPSFDLNRDAFGRWVLQMPDGMQHVPVTALRAYPVSAPDEGVALMNAHTLNDPFMARIHFCR